VSPPQLLDVAQLGEWRAQWDHLVDASPLPSPFLRSWWLEGTSRHERHFLLVVDGTQLLGGLALEQRHNALSIRMMGDGRLCPDHLDLLAANGHEAVVVAHLGAWFSRRARRLFDLNGVRAGSALSGALPGRVYHEPTVGAPFLPLPETAEEYRSTLSTQFRRNLRRGADRLAADGVTHRATRGPAVLGRLGTLRELHQAQWGDRSRFLPVFDRFAAGCVGGCVANEVVVHELASDHVAVAIVVAFEVAGRASLYQSARLTEPRWRDATTVLLAAIIDDACGRGLTEVDFLRGEEPYKSRFTRHRREMNRLVAGSGVTGTLGRVWSSTSFNTKQVAVRCVRFGRSTVARWRA
jgi:CelD/BcsL family acetyltransferase involved in cellulose biosynthesis